MRRDNGFHIGHAGLAELERVSIEDLGKWMVLWDITWYNPPWNCNVKTNLGKKFLHIVDKCFPKNHPLKIV